MYKIIYIVSYHITQRDYHRYGAEYLINKGYDVEIWIVNNGFMLGDDFDISAGMYRGKNMIDIHPKDLEKYVKRNSNAFFIFFDYKIPKWILAMAKYKCNYFLVRGIGATLTAGTNAIKEDRDYAKFLKLKNYINFLNALPGIINNAIAMKKALRCFKHHLPKYIFMGVDIHDDWFKCVPNDKKIYIHSFDYDRYLETKHKNEDVDEEYIVYIDSGYGNGVFDLNKLFNPNKYDPWYEDRENVSNKLNAVFDKLEEHYHAPVVIAGHPHVKYPTDFWCNRRIIFNKTPELVAHSKFVIMQFSTSISFALLFKKSVLALVDNNLKKANYRDNYWEDFFNANYKYFGITPCNMDIQEMIRKPWEYVHAIDEKISQEYINKYIKMPGTPDKLFIEVMEDKMNEIAEMRKRKM